jgi:hypothetical protein
LQDLLGAAAVELDRLVRREQRDTGAFELRSTDKVSYMRRATRDVLSEITTSKRRFGSSSRSAMPPSRAIGMPDLSLLVMRDSGRR